MDGTSIPQDKLTDPKYLLQRVRQDFKPSATFQNPNWQEHASEELQTLLQNMTEMKKEYRVQLKEQRTRKYSKQLNQLKKEQMALTGEFPHQNEWNYSTNSDRPTAPPYSVGGECPDEVRPPDILDVEALAANHPYPWYATSLRGHNFGEPAMSTLTYEYLIMLRKMLQEHVVACTKELKSLTGTTEETQQKRQRCTQALREFEVKLIDIESQINEYEHQQTQASAKSPLKDPAKASRGSE